jgi:hypothetical protein
MSENTTPATPTTPATATQSTEKAKRVFVPKSKGCFPTREEALATKPTNPRQKLYRVSGPNCLWFTYGVDIYDALQNVARGPLGLVATLEDKAPTPEAAAGILASLTPEQRAAVLQQFAPTPTTGAAQPTEPPTDDRPAKGKGGKK